MLDAVGVDIFGGVFVGVGFREGAGSEVGEVGGEFRANLTERGDVTAHGLSKSRWIPGSETATSVTASGLA